MVWASEAAKTCSLLGSVSSVGQSLNPPKETCFQWFGPAKLRKRVAFGVRVLSRPKPQSTKGDVFSVVWASEAAKTCSLWGPCPQSTKGDVFSVVWASEAAKTCSLWGPCPQSAKGDVFSVVWASEAAKTCSLWGPCPQSAKGDVFSVAWASEAAKTCSLWGPCPQSAKGDVFSVAWASEAAKTCSLLGSVSSVGQSAKGDVFKRVQMHPSGVEPRDLGQKPNRFAAWPKDLFSIRTKNV